MFQNDLKDMPYDYDRIRTALISLAVFKSVSVFRLVVNSYPGMQRARPVFYMNFSPPSSSMRRNGTAVKHAADIPDPMKPPAFLTKRRQAAVSGQPPLPLAAPPTSGSEAPFCGTSNKGRDRDRNQEEHDDSSRPDRVRGRRKRGRSDRDWDRRWEHDRLEKTAAR